MNLKIEQLAGDEENGTRTPTALPPTEHRTETNNRTDRRKPRSALEERTGLYKSQGPNLRIPVHRERPFRSNVNTDSDRW